MKKVKNMSPNEKIKILHCHGYEINCISETTRCAVTNNLIEEKWRVEIVTYCDNTESINNLIDALIEVEIKKGETHEKQN